MRKKYQAFSASTTTISRSGAEEPGNKVNILATGLTPNCTSNLYQFYSSVSVLQLCISSTKTAVRHAIHTGLIPAHSKKKFVLVA